LALSALTFGWADPPAESQPEQALEQARRLVRLVETMQAHYRSLGAFRAPFELRYVSSTFGAEQAEAGTLHVVPPAKMLWDYDDPEDQRAVFDGDTWWLVSHEDHTVTRREVGAGGGHRSPLIDLLAGDVDLLTLFSGRVVDPEAADGRVVLELLPREPRDQVDLVVVTMTPDPGTIHRIEVVGPLGGSHVLELGEPVEEEPLAPERFEVTVPEGYTLLEE
jgi:outer membrane lipoprotein-sorting protein